MKKIFFALIGCLTVVCVHAAQIANIEYVHKMIEHKWDITVPYNPMLSNVKSMANMKYLLTAIDVANEILNGEKTTDYGNGEFATLQVADTTATNTAVETLIKKEQKHEFTLTTTPNTSSFEFSISAAGEFVVDWGDGTVETITKPDTTKTYCSHGYDTAGAYTIGLSGQATAYNTDTYNAAISFYYDGDTQSKKIASIDGSLGAIFGTLPDATEKQPRFYQTFYGASNMTGSIPSDLFAGISGAPASNMFESTFSDCRNLTTIPNGLFAGISGAPASYMFAYTFSGCSGLTSIPAGLFAGISGAPAESMFAYTFLDCSGLTSIPAGLFAGISGAPAEGMFSGTFSGCSGLTGAIPSGLFAGISGAPASASFMFAGTFSGCSGLTSIPENLFGNISGTAQDNMFATMFDSCTSLTGPSARINGKYLYEIWPALGFNYVKGPYYGCTGLSDYSTMPAVWRSFND